MAVLIVLFVWCWGCISLWSTCGANSMSWPVMLIAKLLDIAEEELKKTEARRFRPSRYYRRALFLLASFKAIACRGLLL
jgi:hypothetical protein